MALCVLARRAAAFRYGLRALPPPQSPGRPPSTLVTKGRPILGAIVGTVVLIVLTLFATWRHDWLPIVMQGGDYSLLVRKGISPAVWA